MKKLQLVDNQIIELADFNSFTVIGDPGCDGLGAEIMATFTKALKLAKGEFILVLGDIVPFGSKLFYDNVAELIEHHADKNVFMLCGNHDTHYYEEFFGSREYAIVDSRTLLVVLDNSKRSFTVESRELLTRALRDYPRQNIVLAMHIPPPNAITGNSVSTAEWDKILAIIADHGLSGKVKYILAGHLHSYFEEQQGATRVVVSGGGGARIEEVTGIQAPYHHIVNFNYDPDGILTHNKEDVVFVNLDYTDPIIDNMLDSAFKNECVAHVQYQLNAESAAQRGLLNLAHLFRAAAQAELFHARNHYYVMSGLKDPLMSATESLARESGEINILCQEYKAYAKNNALGLPVYTFNDACEAKVALRELLETACAELAQGTDISDTGYFVCSSCGYIFSGETPPRACHICGAPGDKITVLV
ncbi:MAG: metallophosphoesterase [Bacillota bacterium]